MTVSSLYSAQSSALPRQLANVLQTPQAEFELRPVHVQVGGSDCGLFAVALCSGIVTSFTCSFKQIQMCQCVAIC